MAATANSRVTLGAIFGAIQTSAHTLTNTLEAANKGIGMINRSVDSASLKQEARLTIENEDYVSDLIEQSSLNRTESQIRIMEFCADEKKAKLYQQNYDRLSALLKR